MERGGGGEREVEIRREVEIGRVVDMERMIKVRMRVEGGGSLFIFLVKSRYVCMFGCMCVFVCVYECVYVGVNSNLKEG